MKVWPEKDKMCGRQLISDVRASSRVAAGSIATSRMSIDRSKCLMSRPIGRGPSPLCRANFGFANRARSSLCGLLSSIVRLTAATRAKCMRQPMTTAAMQQSSSTPSGSRTARYESSRDSARMLVPLHVIRCKDRSISSSLRPTSGPMPDAASGLYIGALVPPNRSHAMNRIVRSGKEIPASCTIGVHSTEVNAFRTATPTVPESG
mmetsp:Transcript_26026/g.62945  ORF Transcript_26026/g.62945 Transcript_26026/m.62945 type:complete len:206 (+) Transcript_26026:700-1317(+)